MPAARYSSTQLREFITSYYNAHSRVPAYETLASEFGYSSSSTVHYHLQKLVLSGFLVYRREGAFRYEPGPFFQGVPGKAAVPMALLQVLPSREDVQVLRVGDGWVMDDVKPGDLILVGTREPVRPASPVVLRRGRKFVIAEGSRVRRGWESLGVVFGQYRPGAKPTSL